MIAEDALDRTLVRSIETHTTNRLVSYLARGSLNPARSLANILAGKQPWYREGARLVTRPVPDSRPYPAIPSFEFLATARLQMLPGQGTRGICAGGGATAAFRLSPAWELIGDVNGCKLLHVRTNLSGDSLTWMIGPRHVWNPSRRWQPYAQLLVGGRKMTWEEIDPLKKAQVEADAARSGRSLGFADHPLYTRTTEATGLAVMASAGLDFRVNSAIGFRLGEIGYIRSGHSRFEGLDYSHSVAVTTGLVLRWGTW
jgi:hypothetical protein